MLGRDVELTVSCGDDVGDVDVDELEEPVAKPGTNDRCEVFRFALYSSAMFNEMWFLTTAALIGISLIFAQLSKQ